MDDFLFDPWSEDEADVGPETKSPRRWTVRVRTSEPRPRPRPSDSGLARRLRKLALPRIDEVATRLRAARHRTLLDDRLDREEPVLRFRLIPWEGPFDEAPAVAGSVLELIVSEPDVVTARHWPDPVAEAPETEVRVAAEKLEGAWIDGQLLGFVERTLRRG